MMTMDANKEYPENHLRKSVRSVDETGGRP